MNSIQNTKTIQHNPITFPELAVIVPIYNMEKYIRRCVNSLLNQDYPNIKIILVNDGSTDNSGKYCEELASEHPNISLIHKENGGQASARNAGLEICNSQFVTFVDPDDYIDSTDTYRINMNYLINDNNVDIVQFPIILIGEDNIRLEDKPIFETDYKVFSSVDEYCQNYILFACTNPLAIHTSCCNKIFRLSQIKQLRFKSMYSEDENFLFNSFENARKIIVSTAGMYGYYQRPNSDVNSPYTYKKHSACIYNLYIFSSLLRKHSSNKVLKTKLSSLLLDKELYSVCKFNEKPNIRNISDEVKSIHWDSVKGNVIDRLKIYSTKIIGTNAYFFLASTAYRLIYHKTR